MVFPKRQTVLVAKQAAMVDLFSGGRLRLGFSVVWKPDEYQAMGADFHIPIWIGGFADIVLRRAAKLGDGWMATFLPDQFKESVTKLHTYLAETGRDSPGFGISNHIYLAETPEDLWGKLLEEWHKLGVTHVEFSLMGSGLQTVDAYIGELRRFQEVVKIRKK
jgi:alkanesulfonate monooxygenase SsuD/methylene tetrahydromethanopterin reductase-like flavin-dependent oxidoreductase (luciferase family)